jgi:diadenylate cyclase
VAADSSMTPGLPTLGGLLDEVVDLVIVTASLLLLLRILRRSRARLALVGVLLIGFVDLAARQFGLPLTAWLFQRLFLISIVVLLLAFQDDLKRLFERLAVWGLGRGHAPQGGAVLETLVRATSALAAARHGALIVLPGREPLDRHLTGGVVLDGALSEPLLLSLFDPHSPGHDGAVVLEGGFIRRFAVHLPLSTDLSQLGAGGTRHAAALGLAERSDAFVIVVSEERGTTGVAQGGRLQTMGDPEDLAWRLRSFSGEILPRSERRRAARTLSALAEWGVASGVALALWLLVVFGGESDQRIVRIPVAVTNVPAGYVLRSVSPDALTVTLSGPRRDVFFMQPSEVAVTVDALLAQLGRRTFDVPPQSVRVPPGVTVKSVEPGRVTLDLERPQTP